MPNWHFKLVGRLTHAPYDSQFKAVFDAIRLLMAPPAKPARRIGFRTGRDR